MSRLVLLCGLLVAFHGHLKSQTINAAEYFFDADPGVGNGTALTVPGPGAAVTFTASISIAGLDPGYHLLFVRTQDSNGQWSLFDLKPFEIEAPIEQLEYFFDVDPGIGNGTLLSIPAGQLSLTGIITTASLSDGEHILFIRTRHEDEWSMLSPVAFYVHTRVTEVEYFIDTDPGFGNAASFSVSVPAGEITETPDINVGSLMDGDHYLFVRTLDALGVWSFFEPVVFTVSTPLPIELSKFTARATRNGTVTLDWTTLTERGNDYFSVQHSTDGSEFGEFARVKGAGNNPDAHSYQLVHDQPAAGLNYYRLKQVDVNGGSAFSNVVAVTLMGEGGFTVFPNPATDEWFIDFSGTEAIEPRLVELFDITGRKCLVAESKTGSLLPLRRGELASGIYLLRVSSPDGVTVVHKLSFR